MCETYVSPVKQEHCDWAAAAWEYIGHARHDVDPAITENVFSGQLEQRIEDAAAVNVPGAHSLHSLSRA